MQKCVEIIAQKLKTDAMKIERYKHFIVKKNTMHTPMIEKIFSQNIIRYCNGQLSK